MFIADLQGIHFRFFVCVIQFRLQIKYAGMVATPLAPPLTSFDHHVCVRWI